MTIKEKAVAMAKTVQKVYPGQVALKTGQLTLMLGVREALIHTLRPGMDASSDTSPLGPIRRALNSLTPVQQKAIISATALGGAAWVQQMIYSHINTGMIRATYEPNQPNMTLRAGFAGGVAAMGRELCTTGVILGAGKMLENEITPYLPSRLTPGQKAFVSGWITGVGGGIFTQWMHNMSFLKVDDYKRVQADQTIPADQIPKHLKSYPTLVREYVGKNGLVGLKPTGGAFGLPKAEGLLAKNIVKRSLLIGVVGAVYNYFFNQASGELYENSKKML